jgi:hypothetical protein
MTLGGLKPLSTLRCSPIGDSFSHPRLPNRGYPLFSAIIVACDSILNYTTYRTIIAKLSPLDYNSLRTPPPGAPYSIARGGQPYPSQYVACTESLNPQIMKLPLKDQELSLSKLTPALTHVPQFN